VGRDPRARGGLILASAGPLTPRSRPLPHERLRGIIAKAKATALNAGSDPIAREDRSRRQAWREASLLHALASMAGQRQACDGKICGGLGGPGGIGRPGGEGAPGTGDQGPVGPSGRAGDSASVIWIAR
jgi:hypothetical protein